ncbi:RluA family pseudouridine synthase [Gilvimarinus chinensis]|uniref:RluA family pseudouridine synthase n=1 Tax=Gilvimarinus chinensis TaxID=396005 RepID=UPI00038236DE|nr:pseudouridine synthase [Gilvimarinus chinensis]
MITPAGNTPIRELAILPPCKEDIDILQETPDFVLINKPAGLLSVPGRHPDNNDCVHTRLEKVYPGCSIIHRLDFDTSGIMAVARNKAAHGFIAKQFQARETYKLYTAVVEGELADSEGVIDLAIAPDKTNRPKYKIDIEEGKPSVTRYRVLHFDAATNTSRLELEPLTGRSHQLRLHMAAMGHSILGCGFYASENTAALSKRLLLHATRLRFKAPGRGELIDGFSPCPF